MHQHVEKWSESLKLPCLFDVTPLDEIEGMSQGRLSTYVPDESGGNDYDPTDYGDDDGSDAASHDGQSDVHWPTEMRVAGKPKELRATWCCTSLMYG